jgi:hypothetical protein
MGNPGSRRWAVVAAVLATLVRPVESRQSIADLPFDLYQGHLIVIKGALGGLTGLRILVDTGTIPSVVDRRVARRLRVQPVHPTADVAFARASTGQLARFDAFAAGPLQVPELWAGIGDLSYLEPARVDVIAGLDVLVRASVTIDYRARVLSFRPPRATEWSAPLEIVRPFIMARLSVAGSPLHLLVDTGSAELVVFKARLPKELFPLPWHGDKVMNYASGPARLLRVLLPAARLGNQTWDTLPAFALDRSTEGYPPGIDGVLGIGALGATQVQFDFERGELGWNR